MREIAGLLTILHTQSLDFPRAARIAVAAGVACADNDVALPWFYLDLLLISLARFNPEKFESKMDLLGYEYQRYFVRRYYGHGKEGQAEGWAEGLAEGRAQMLVALLASRFGPLTEATQVRVRGAQDAQFDAVAKRIFTAQTLEEALSQLF